MTPDQLIEQLAAFEPTGFPFVSLYLNTMADETGRENYDSFLRKRFEELSDSFAARSADRESFEKDVARINEYLENERDKSANGVAIFSCTGADFFETAQLEAPFERHRLSVADYPDIYPLARLLDQYPVYAALLVDTNSARIFVFGQGGQRSAEAIKNEKTNRSQMGGWSQARYQRHTENIHLHHVKEVVEALERIVREEGIQHLILSGDEAVIPLLREQLNQELNEKVIDVLRLDIKTPEHEVLSATLERMRVQDAEADAAKVERLVNEYRAGGLGVVGVHKTRAAFELGQVDELLISAQRSEVKGKPAPDKGVPRPVTTPEVIATAVATGTPEVSDDAVAVSDELVRHAHRTAARITFIEDPALLAEFGGVGALLRFTL